MNPLASPRNVGRVMEKLFSKQIQENIERINLLEKKIVANIFMCENFLKQFPDDSRLTHLIDDVENCSSVLCAELRETLHMRNSSFGVLISHGLENSKFGFTDDAVSPVNSVKASMRSEFVRLECAKRLSDSLTIQLEAEEAYLNTEISFLARCLENKPIQMSEFIDQQATESLVTECDNLKERCLKSIKELACSDQLETSRLKFDRQKARQAAYLDAQERKIQEVQLTCSKLEIFRDIMALEESAFHEMSLCIEKISFALQRYLDISTDMKSRFEKAGSSLETVSDPSLIDDELRVLLTSLLIDPLEESDKQEMVSNEILLKKLEEKIAFLDGKNSASLSIMKEFGRVAHDILHLLERAFQWLECSDSSEAHQHNEASESPCIYWNALASFSGVIPHRLVELLLQVRKELDGACAALRKLELSFELKSEIL